MASKEELLSTELRELHSKLYEKEMNLALEELYNFFIQWKGKEMSPFDLQSKIHQFYSKRAKELYSIYQVASFADLNAARCIKDGIISIDELSPTLKNLIEPKIKIL